MSPVLSLGALTFPHPSLNAAKYKQCVGVRGVVGSKRGRGLKQIFVPVFVSAKNSLLQNRFNRNLNHCSHKNCLVRPKLSKLNTHCIYAPRVSPAIKVCRVGVAVGTSEHCQACGTIVEPT